MTVTLTGEPADAPAPGAAAALRFDDLGRMPYGEALAVQRRVHAEVVAGERPPTVLLVEHEPVVTLPRRPSARVNLIADEAELARLGVALHETDRGGDVTYHGPGQIVMYPIVSIRALGLSVRRYVATLEQIVIDTLAAFDITASRDKAGIGVWVDVDGRRAKIAAVGVRVARWVTLHGLALNVETDLRHFQLIVPCGLREPVTSMHTLLGPRCPDIDTLKQRLVQSSREHLSV